MRVKIWGVRGSLPVPDRRTLRFGGNTTCISVETSEKILVFDAGTGIRVLGETLFDDDRDVYVVLTHLHNDHVQGFPFFGPLYRPGPNVFVLDYEWEGRSWSLLNLFDGVHMPITSSELPRAPQRVCGDAREILGANGFDVRSHKVNHPMGAYGYRVDSSGGALVFIPDNELIPQSLDAESFNDLADFCEGAEILIHDAQYLAREADLKKGWGHSTVDQACALAAAAGVRQLVLFHHDPSRHDESLEEIEGYARNICDPHGIECSAAFEGQTFIL